MGGAEVSIDKSQRVPIITATGEIDIATAALLIDQFDELPSQSGNVVVDLSGVTFLDSSGLGALIACKKRLDGESPPGSMRLVVSRPQILKLFDITGLREVFPIAATLEEAIAES